MDLPAFIDSYGYVAVLAGAFMEGETILALAGLAAYRGYLDLWTVIGAAMVAGFAGDQLYFFLGRWNGARILARFPAAQARAQRLDAMLERWHAPIIVAIRFMYGLRIAGPVLLGMGRVPAWKFMLYNFIGAALWAPLIAGLGYGFGSVIATFLDDIERYELWLFIAIAAVAIGAALSHRARQRRKSGGPR